MIWRSAIDISYNSVLFNLKNLFVYYFRELNFKLAAVRLRSLIMTIVLRYLSMLRVSHYVKNLYVFLPAFFSGKLFIQQDFIVSVEVFAAFCLISSAVYIINDVADRKTDALHPEKKLRPIASGLVTIPVALFIACLLLIISLTAGYYISTYVSLIIAGYFVLNLLYTYKLKHEAIIDVAIISTGFVLRVVAGGQPNDIPASKWLVLMVFLLSMFQALAKRLSDLRLIQNTDEVQVVRKSLDGYNVEFLQIVSSILSGILIVCYIMYITQPEIIQRFGEGAYFTAFFVLIGLLRYLQLTYVHYTSGSPVKIFLKDRFIQLCVICWLLAFSVLIYVK